MKPAGVPDLIALIGVVFVLGGIWWLSPVAAVIVAGVLLIVYGFALYIAREDD